MSRDRRLVVDRLVAMTVEAFYVVVLVAAALLVAALLFRAALAVARGGRS